MTEREAYIALNMIEKVGPVGVRAMSSVVGSVAAILAADCGALMQARGVGAGVAEAILAARDRVDWKGEMERAAAIGARILTPVDEEYPAILREIHDPPLALYVWGRLESRDRHAVAVVGTRRPTHYGRETARAISFGLAKAGFSVVSGLATGIDTAAHEGALAAKGRTLAVIGSGIDRIYPDENRDLARRIAESGAVLSEFVLGRQPDKTTFPIRNRLVSGLSMGVLVVEAGRQSGAMITANQAAEQGRTVFAVPGRIDSPASQGTHRLIREGAQLVTGVDDVLSEFDALVPAERRDRPEIGRPMPAVSGEEQRLLSLLDSGEQDVDTLIRLSGLKAGTVSSLLIGLEMKRLVRMLPGRCVQRMRGDIAGHPGGDRRKGDEGGRNG